MAAGLERLMRSQAGVSVYRYLGTFALLTSFALARLHCCGCVSQQQYRTGYDPITCPSALTSGAGGH